jgi:hypothetical protein
VRVRAAVMAVGVPMRLHHRHVAHAAVPLPPSICCVLSSLLVAVLACDDPTCACACVCACAFVCVHDSPACRDGTNGGDYFFDDGQGHNYTANICGTASTRCLPKDWCVRSRRCRCLFSPFTRPMHRLHASLLRCGRRVATDEWGVAVQFFGDVPPCDMNNGASTVDVVGDT